MKETKLMLIFTLLIFAASIWSDVITIEEIQTNTSDYLDQVVEIEAVVTVGAATIQTAMLNTYVQDESGMGINVFDYNLNETIQADFARGTKMSITGTVTEYNGTTEIVDFQYTVLETGLAVVPTELTYAEMSNFSLWEGTFTSFSGTLNENPYYAGGGYNVNLTDDSGHSVTARVWDTTGINLNNMTEGVPITVHGVISSYNSSLQIIPAYQEDLEFDIHIPVINDFGYYSDSMDDYPQIDNPFIDEEITLWIDAVDFDGEITEVKLMYRTENQSTNTEELMTYSNNHYEFILPSIASVGEGLQNYLFSISVTDDSLNTVSVDDAIVEVQERHPIVADVTFNGNPALGDTLVVQADVFDTDGTVEEVFLTYSKNYNSKEYEVELLNDDRDTYSAEIGVFESGTTIHIRSVYAIDDSSLGYTEVFDVTDNDHFVTYPVETHESILRIAPKVYKYLEDEIPIDYFSKLNDKAILRIYNAEGKLVFTPKNEIISNTSGINRFNWDGRDQEHKLVPIGIYYCFLEIIDRDTGKKKTNKAPIVIGDKLN